MGHDGRDERPGEHTAETHDDMASDRERQMWSLWLMLGEFPAAGVALEWDGGLSTVLSSPRTR
jgi:hypothetical protein